MEIVRRYDNRSSTTNVFLLNSLSSSQRIYSFLQNKLSNTDGVNQIVANSCGSVLYFILHVSNNLRAKIRAKDLEKYQNTLFVSFITFLDEHFMNKKCSKVKQQQNDLLINQILSFLWNTADTTSTVPILIYAKCPRACLRWISLSYLNIEEYRCLISILHNMARHDEAATVLNKYECPKILRLFKSQILDGKIDFIVNNNMYVEIQVLFYMILALVMDPEELRGDAVNNTVIKCLLSKTISASESPKFRCEGFHISEPLIVLMKLCVNDDIIHFILQKNETLIFFCTILGQFLIKVKHKRVGDIDIDLDVLTIMALVNILWSISFHDRYKNELIKNFELIKTLEKFCATGLTDKVLANSFIPYRMSSLTKAIQGIRENLFPSKPEIKPSMPNKSIQSLMISYSHANMTFCRQLYDMLSKEPTLSIWVDFNGYKSSDLWEEIAHAIEQSDYVLFLMSKEYFNSKSCRQEVAYVTDTLKKEFIPIYVDTDFKASGWLGIRIAGSQYIRFGKNDFTDTYKELLSIINKSHSTVTSSHLISLPLPNKISPDIKEWTEKEITQWFTDNNIMSELCQFYQFQNGNELLLYSEAMQTLSWLNEYENIQLKFREKFKGPDQQLSTHQFIKFVNALKSLQNKKTNQ